MQFGATEFELIEADGIGAGEDGSSKMHGLWSDAKFSAYAVRTASGQSQFFFFLRVFVRVGVSYLGRP